MQKAIGTSVAALCGLGMLGESLIIADSGFATSSTLGALTIGVPVPQAFIAASIMFALSGVALICFLQQFGIRAWCASLYLRRSGAHASAQIAN